jgi:sugar lactone lactonase YvrE
VATRRSITRLPRRATWPALGAGVLAMALTGCSSGTSPHAAATTPETTAAAPAQAGTDASTNQTQSGFLAGLHTVSTVASTIPENLDVNPYAVIVATSTAGRITKGNLLVDNFNGKSNFQGTGTTIVQITPAGTLSTFASIPANQAGCPGGIGLSTAMTELSTGYVVVGSAPSTDGTTATQGAGCLLVLNPQGQVVSTIQGGDLDGPWDMTAVDNGSHATLYVTNTLHGVGAVGQPARNAGTVVRMELNVPAAGAPTLVSETVIGSGFPELADSNTFVDGPTGVALTANGTLYVSDRVGNRIMGIPQAATRTTSAGTGTVLTSGGRLDGPLSMTLAPNGDLLVANGLNGQLVEITTTGRQIANAWLDQDPAQTPAGSGDLFGIALNADRTGVYFAMDDNNAVGLIK